MTCISQHVTSRCHSWNATLGMSLLTCHTWLLTRNMTLTTCKSWHVTLIMSLLTFHSLNVTLNISLSTCHSRPDTLNMSLLTFGYLHVTLDMGISFLCQSWEFEISNFFVTDSLTDSLLWDLEELSLLKILVENLGKSNIKKCDVKIIFN